MMYSNKITRSVNIRNTLLTQLPIKFGKVSGYFDCKNNQLTTLKGGPKEVGHFYSCSNNKLTNLLYAPKVCNDVFFCRSNLLTSLEGCPRIIKSDLYCDNNPLLKYLWGIGRVEGYVHYDNRNKINVWIIECMRKGVIFPYYTLEKNIKWIKNKQNYSILLDAPEEIRKYFSPYVKNILLDLC